MAVTPPPGTPPPGGPGAGPTAAAAQPPWRVAAFVLGVVAVVVLTIVLAAAARDRGQEPSATRIVSVSADSVRTVELQGPPGHLRIDAVRTSRVTLAGPVHWTGRSGVIVTGPRLAGGVLHLAYRCAAHSPCTGRLRLVVPQRCGIVLRQPSGHVTVSGLAGPLWISARSVDVSAAGLRSPSLAATITSGHLSAAFASPPRRVNVTLISAQATLHLPARAAYRLSQQVTSGYVHAGIPQAGDAGRTITARIDNGELELLPG
ncbi:MAG: hypothetical protein QOG05_5250 [Streptosporangiaceae bacterium]|nr:hypothetical protein [Streptosporangiaceae bacterium]